jgi:Mrp family chromosome partitioning ATPase
MDIARYIRILRRRWGVLAVFGLVGMVIGWTVAARADDGGGSSGKTVYVATHTISVGSALGNSSIILEPDQIAAQVNGGVIPGRVAERQGGQPAEFTRRGVASANSTLREVYLSARADTARKAEELAEVFFEETAAWVSDRQQRTAESEKKRRQESIDVLNQQISALGDSPRDLRLRDKYLLQIDGLQAEIAALDVVGTGEGPELWNFGKAIPVTKAAADEFFKSAAQARPGRRNSSTPTTLIASSDVQVGNDSSLPPPLGGLLGGGLGSGLAAMLVFGWAALDPRLFTKEQAEAAFGFPVISEIPVLSRRQRKETAVLSRDAPLSRFAEAYRGLASAVLYLERAGSGTNGSNGSNGSNGNGSNGSPGSHPPDDDIHDDPPERRAVTVMITSPSPSEGKTTTAANLAAVLAEGGRDVLAVSCDFRRPRLHLYLGCEHEPRTVLNTDIPRVFLVSSVVGGDQPHSPGEVVAEQRRVITAARSKFDYIVLDTAPMLTTSDASELLPVTDMVVTVCRAGRTNREAADRTAEMLERFEAPVVGAVLVGSSEGVIPRYYYYYSEGARPGGETADATPPNPLAELRRRDGGQADAHSVDFVFGEGGEQRATSSVSDASHGGQPAEDPPPNRD